MAVLISTVHRFVIATWLHPGFDEAYYYLYTLNPQWSYFDHPLLVGWVTQFGIALTGEVTQLTIRLGSLLLYTLALVLLALAGRHLFSPRTGRFTLALAAGIPIFHVAFGTLILPDSPLIFFWALTIYVAALEFFPTSLIHSRPYQPTWKLSLLCALVGLACLGKYHGLALGLGLTLFCVGQSKYRRVFTSPYFAVGVGLFLLCWLPILYWNSQHDWASFRYQSNRASEEGGAFRWGNLGLAVAKEMAYLFPTFGIPMAGLGLLRLSQLGRRVHGRGERYALVVALSMPLIVVMTWVGGFRDILPTWPMPGFLGLTLLLAESADRHWQSWHGWLKPIWWGSLGVILLLETVGLAHVSGGLLQKPNPLSPSLAVIPIEEDASTQLFDVQQLRQQFIRDPQLAQALAESDFIFTNHYFLGGQIAMALTPLHQTPITCYAQDVRGFAFWSTPNQWVGRTGLFITSALFEQFPGQDDPMTAYSPYFQSFRFLGEVPILRAGIPGQRFRIYEGVQQTRPYPRPYGLGSF
ncbi:MAG: hypothetical protein OHK0012_18150 [Synechococcales cyanobacterium]